MRHHNHRWCPGFVLGTGTCNATWKRPGLTVASGTLQPPGWPQEPWAGAAPRDTLAAQARTIAGPVAGPGKGAMWGIPV